MFPDQAFVLAAGYGKRLRPHTAEKPKPMVAVHGLPMIDHALNALETTGVKSCVVNTHYKAEILHEHLAKRTAPKIHISHEDTLLDTGGGIKNGLSHIDGDFFVLSGDSVWEDSPGTNALETLANAWDPDKMDILMLLQPVSSMTLTKGIGDYDIDDEGRATRSPDQTGKYMFTSIRINASHIFDDEADGPFSYLKLMDEAQNKGRLYAIINQGIWHHISTPEDLEAVNAQEAERK